MHSIAHCIGCNCSDYNACRTAGGVCCWLRVDYTEGKGVCSACPEQVQRWDAGERDIRVEVRR
jgi:hypothetical protein